MLIAEDDLEMRRLLVLALEGAGCRVTEVENGILLADELLEGPRYDVVVSDFRMPGLTALEVLEGIEDSPDRPPLVLITAFGSPHLHRLARELGASEVLDKPFRLDALLAIVRRLAAAPDRGAAE